MTSQDTDLLVNDYLYHVPGFDFEHAGFQVLDDALAVASSEVPLEVMPAQRILAAAAVIDRRLNGTHLELPATQLSAIDRLDLMACQNRAGPAARAVWSVSHNQGSALKEQWVGGLRFSEWTTHLWGVHDRLMNQAATLGS